MKPSFHVSRFTRHALVAPESDEGGSRNTQHATRNTFHASRPTSRRREEASAVIVVMALLAIVLIYIAGNLRSLQCLDRELKLVERRQIRRLESPTRISTAVTNLVPVPQPVRPDH